MSKGGSFARRVKCANFFFHLREKMSGISAREGEKLPEKIPVGKFLPGIKFREEIFRQEHYSALYFPRISRNLNS